MKVSVCMAVHNGASFLKEQVDSILEQLEPTDELIISDDQSTDQSLSILKSYQDFRIHLLPPQKFGAPLKNFEYALTQCSGDVIFLADQDDVWHPEKIKRMKSILMECDMVVCNCSLVDSNRNIKVPSFFEFNRSKSGLVNNLIRNSFVGCCMGFTRQVMNKALPFPHGILMHDQWIGLVAQHHFQVQFTPEILVEHRIHQHNYSTTGRASKNSWNNKLISRLKLTRMLLER